MRFLWILTFALALLAAFAFQHVHGDRRGNGDRNREVKPRDEGPGRYHPDIGRNPDRSDRRSSSRNRDRKGGSVRNRKRPPQRENKHKKQRNSSKKHKKNRFEHPVEYA